MEKNQNNSQEYKKRYRHLNKKQTMIRNRVAMVAAVLVVLTVAVGGTTLLTKNMNHQEDPVNVSPTSGGTMASSGGNSGESPAPSTVSGDNKGSQNGENTGSSSQGNSIGRAEVTADFSFTQWNASCGWEMTVVNASNKVPDSWTVDIDYDLYENVGIDRRITDQVQALINHAFADDCPIWVSSGYRDAELQAQLLENEIQENLNAGMSQDQAEIEAKKLVMPAGYSEHQTGLVIDINGVDADFYETQAYAWMTEHAADYGFIERYPRGKEDITGINFEPWHYRYVGVENAKAIQASGLCLEEYVFQKMKQG